MMVIPGKIDQSAGREMDPLDELVQGLRFRGSFYRSFDVRAPWCLDIPERRWISFHFQAVGRSCLRVDRHCFELSTGDFLVLPHGPAHTFSDSALTPIPNPDASIEYLGFGPSLRIDGPGERSVLVCGGARLAGPAALVLLSQLSTVVQIPNRKGQALYWLRPTLEAIDSEAHHWQPGSDTVIARLVDVLLIHSVRAWIASAPDRSGWIRAMRDPNIGRSLALMHASPERPWDIQSLAKSIGMCRASFAERFVSLVGKPPMTYLTECRMNFATTLLRDEPITLAQLSERLGYGSEAAFSRAYKKHFGIAPGAYRRMIEHSSSVV